jgi:hypothetical protein
MSPSTNFKIQRLKKLLSIVILMGLAIAAVIYEEVSYNEITCTGIVVKLDSENEKPLLGKQDINLMVTNQGSDYFLNKPLNEISLHQIEQRVKRIPLVNRVKRIMILVEK